jgi:beta-N-acetylhexosaminidase
MLGPVMLDVAGTALTAEERERLRHPRVGGLILFARNYESPRQLRALTDAVRSLRDPELLIAVDHEGGRVQRFRQGFTPIPPMRTLGAARGRAPSESVMLARAAGSVIAVELQAHGVDFSFAPVLDIDFGTSGVIGDRAFAADPERVAELAGALIDGLNTLGMAAVGKHFPGHGHAAADSHFEMPVDERELAQIDAADLVPYRRMITRLAGVMPAHVIYPKIDSRPAGFSPVWLQTILRGRLGFRGLIFSDDLSMEGASGAGGMAERARAALGAGCDMVLVCNAPEAAARLLGELEAPPLEPRLAALMRGRNLRQPASAHGGYAAAVALLQNAADTGALVGASAGRSTSRG